jgi:DNA-binding response OmpR family regulator
VLSLVESLLDQARGADGRIALFSRVFDVSEACQDAAHELQILAGEKGLALRAETPLSLDVFADEQKIRQVLQNLITNALTHSRGGKEVVVRARLRKRPDGDVALIEVRDDGTFEDPNEVLMAFERSKGLGLSICRDFVERHGGEIWAEAPADGGAIFAFTLPMPEGQHKALPTRKSEPLVLLVDDDPIFSRIATMGLSGHYRVELARDGNEAVARARSLQPDVIIMDVFMPNRDGLDALRELQSRPETENIPVILLSARPELPERIRPAELGAADFVAKPLPPSVLLARVQAAVQRSRGRPLLAAGPGNDPETGLYDHIGVANLLEQEISRSARYGRPIALAVLKPLQASAESVGRCAAVIRKELKSPDCVGHLGNGVFVVVMPETAVEAAQSLVGRLVGLLADERIPYRSRMGDVRDIEGGAELVLERLLA